MSRWAAVFLGLDGYGSFADVTFSNDTDLDIWITFNANKASGIVSNGGVSEYFRYSSGSLRFRSSGNGGLTAWTWTPTLGVQYKLSLRISAAGVELLIDDVSQGTASGTIINWNVNTIALYNTTSFADCEIERLTITDNITASNTRDWLNEVVAGSSTNWPDVSGNGGDATLVATPTDGSQWLLIGGGLTPISKTFSVLFNADQRLSKPYSVYADLLQRVTDDYIIDIDLLNSITKSYAVNFDVLQREVVDYIINTDFLISVNKSWSMRVDLLSSASVIKDFGISVDLRSRITKDYLIVTDLLTKVGFDYVIFNDLLSRVIKDYEIRNNLNEQITKDYSIIINTIQQINKLFTIDVTLQGDTTPAHYLISVDRSIDFNQEDVTISFKSDTTLLNFKRD